MEAHYNKSLTVDIAGTRFLVDTEMRELREAEAQWNRIPFDAIGDMTDGIACIAFDKRTKNICEDLIDPEHVPAHVTLVIIKLDAVQHSDKQISHNRVMINKQVSPIKRERKSNRRHLH